MSNYRMSNDLLSELLGESDKDYVFRIAVKKIAHILSQKIDKNGIYEISDECIYDLADEIASQLYISTEDDYEEDDYLC